MTLLICAVTHAETVRYENAVIFGQSKAAFVVKDGRFVNESTSADRTVDLNGGFVVPHLMDAHAHLFGLGQSLVTGNLLGTKSFEEVVRRGMTLCRREGTTHRPDKIFGSDWSTIRPL